MSNGRASVLAANANPGLPAAVLSATTSSATDASVPPSGDSRGKGLSADQADSDPSRQNHDPMGLPSTSLAAPPTVAIPPTMTGEWGGLRTRWREKGIDLTSSYTSEFGANTSGGKMHSIDAAGQFSAALNLDTDKLLHIKDSHFQFAISARNGHNLSTRAGLGTLMQVQEVWGRGNVARITELSYRQAFLNKKLEVKLGRLPVGEGFNIFDCQAMNLTFCGAQTGNVADNWYNYPVSQWAIRFRYREKSWYVGVGFYEENLRNLRPKFRAGYFHGATGVLIPYEAAWTPQLGAQHLPGTWRVGGWYDTSKARDVLLADDHDPLGTRTMEPLKRRGRYGFYAQILQQVTGTSVHTEGVGQVPSRGISLFVNYTHTDKRTQKLISQIAGGVIFKAPFAGRPADSLFVAIGQTRVNHRWATQQLLSGADRHRAHSEYVTEVYYQLAVRDWLIMRPNVQYIWNAGGYSRAKDIVILGAKCEVDF